MFFSDIHKRIKIILISIVLLFFLIVFKVFYIQVINYDKLNNLAKDLWSRNLPLEANRGNIYDSTGNLLASSLTTTSLVLIPNQIKNKKDTAVKLAKILNVTEKEMMAHVRKKTSIERVHPEGRRLSYEIADEINKLKLPGVYLVKEAKRYYPHDTWMSHTLGYVGIDNQGLGGLELTYDKYLTGSNGAIKYFSDAKGKTLNISQKYEKPQNGMNMTLTINKDIQQSLERELDNAVSMYTPDHAIGIVMDPNSGEILAISSRPNFNSNNYKEYKIEDINRNLPVWMTYEPGSTFKIITLATSLEEKIVDLEKDNFNDTGSITVSGAHLHCWRHGGHGMQTYLEVVENSCNPGFVNLGLKLGKETLFKYIKNFGFGKKTNVDIIGESSGILFDEDKISELELATTAFGQGVSVTPIQQIAAVSAIINGGKLYKPYIVKSINEPETNSVILENKPKIIRKVISEDTSEKVRYALESVVARGTGHNAYIPDYRVGGKTGTAQKVENGIYLKNNYITSFIGFMPANDPKVIVYIAIDNAKGVTQYGGTVAAPIAKNVLNSIIDILNIEKQKDEIPKEFNYIDKVYVKVPNVVGMNKNDATNNLKNFKIEYSGDGDKVIYQSPKEDTQVLEGETIKLMLN